MKKVCVILFILCFFFLSGISLQEAYEQAGSMGDYNKYLELETGQVYEGGLLIGRIFDPISQQLQGNEGMDVKIKGNGAILDLKGQQIAISYVYNRLDIEDCIILNGNIRYRGDNGLIPQQSPYGEVKHITFYQPHDYAVRMQSSGRDINVTKNIIVDTQDTGLDYIAYTGLSNDWLPTGNCIAISVFVDWYGLPILTDNWTYFSNEEVNADTLRHYVSLCEYGCTAPSAVSWAAQQNFMGQDPQLIDPDNGNYRVKPGTPAVNYGCQTFSEKITKIRSSASTSSRLNKSPEYSKDLIVVGGNISEDTFWNADTVIVIGDILIENGIELQIAAGSDVIFQDHYKISVEGTITAIGTAEEPIIFSSAHPEYFLIDTTPLGSWNGIHFWQTSSLNKASKLEYCTFQYTKALPQDNYPHPHNGGAISIYNFSKLDILNCTFKYNLAFYGGAISCNLFSNPKITNNLFHHNYAWEKGSAIYISNSYPNLNNNTITHNEDLNQDINLDTAAVYNFISKTKIFNNIIYDNSSYYFEQTDIREPKAYYTKFNNIECAIAGEGNISIVPDFFDPANCDFSLKSGSGCIDKGNENLETHYTQLDLLGNERIVGNCIDMGAIEFQATGNGPETVVPNNITLQQNFPNPFLYRGKRSQTSISYSLPKNTKEASLTIFNLRGQLVKNFTLTNTKGNIYWNGRDQYSRTVGSGIYLYTLSTQNNRKTKKLLFLR